MDMIEVLKEICYSVRDEVLRLGRDEAHESFGTGAGGDTIRKIDLVAERKAIEVIGRHGIDCMLLSEEAGMVKIGDGSNGMFVLDAIDGTTNALRGIPIYSCSIAYATSDTLSSVTHAAVMNIPSGDIYYSVKNDGAYMNGRRLIIRDSSGNKGYVIGVNLSGIEYDRLLRLKNILAKTNHIRQLGSNALELCYLAEGLIDAYIDIRGKIRVTDIAAAYLLVREAGGSIVDEYSNTLDAYLSLNKRLSFIAAAGYILDDITKDIII